MFVCWIASILREIVCQYISSVCHKETIDPPSLLHCYMKGLFSFILFLFFLPLSLSFLLTLIFSLFSFSRVLSLSCLWVFVGVLIDKVWSDNISPLPIIIIVNHGVWCLFSFLFVFFYSPPFVFPPPFHDKRWLFWFFLVWLSFLSIRLTIDRSFLFCFCFLFVFSYPLLLMSFLFSFFSPNKILKFCFLSLNSFYNVFFGFLFFSFFSSFFSFSFFFFSFNCCSKLIFFFEGKWVL